MALDIINKLNKQLENPGHGSNNKTWDDSNIPYGKKPIPQEGDPSVGLEDLKNQVYLKN
jgi:hypothetical protein|tara:strand:+ start:1854 stop:2030 length:177 start_codon:yes stop_codon:yes gene_type:complete